MNMTELNELRHLSTTLHGFAQGSKDLARECGNKKDKRTEWDKLTPYYKGKQDAYIRAAIAVENLIERLGNK
jgi:hypothetical protein